MPQYTLYNFFNKSPAPGKCVSEPIVDPPIQITGNNVTPGCKIRKSPTVGKSLSKPIAGNNTPVRTPSGKIKKFKLETMKSNEKKKLNSSSEQDVNFGSPESPPHKRRKRILEELETEDEDSGNEYEPDNLEESEDDLSTPLPSSENESDNSSETDEVSQQRCAGKRKIKNSVPDKKLNGKSKTQSKNDKSFSVSNKEAASSTVGVSDINHTWPHLNLDFLKPDKIRDGQRRLANDSNYDSKTLYVPEEFKKCITPAVRQWWELKSKYFDVVLFFKVGKFYELYHMDAVIAAKELNLTFMRGEFAHVGFPEIAYGRFSSTLVEKGYKVARVEQTETPDMMSERCRMTGKTSKFDRVVKREICQITTRGTRTFGVFDGKSKDAESHFLLAIAEKEMITGCLSYGVCFVDTSIGTFRIGQFTDDRHSSRLRTLAAHYPPAQILYEKGNISANTQKLFDTVFSEIRKESLHSDNEFWSSSKTLIILAEGSYFEDQEFPDGIEKFIGGKTTINTMVNSDKDLGIRALGAVVWYLKRCLLDHQLISLKQFVIYKPVDDAAGDPDTVLACPDSSLKVKHMVLDAVTLKNLAIIKNSNGGLEGTLLQKLDNCCTAFGKRLLHHWICNPLSDVEEIQERQEAVTCLKNSSISSGIRSLLSQLPDLERLLSKIHAQGSNGLEASHPDNRAVMFEEKTYSKRKIIDFVLTLNGFKSVQKIADEVQDTDVASRSRLIARYFNDSSNEQAIGLFPNLTQHLTYFENAFDHAEAQKEGSILPKEGIDSEYDEVMLSFNDIQRSLDKYLKEQSEYFGCKISYYGSDKKRFQLEIPDHLSKLAGSGYELQSQRKGYRRYTTARSKELLEKMIAVEEQKVNVLKNMRQKIFAQFSSRYEDWSRALKCMSVLDVLISFAEYYLNEEKIMCLPEFVLNPAQPFVSLIEGRYPCAVGDEVFIPNDTRLGSEAEEPNLILVTGPNMGGKSTLMRQLGLIAIMAHMGCHVPARELKLSITDRIFTRIGANDDIMAGESTFYVELCETSSILQHATKHSLVLIDELGRGTSTFDGTAIAAAVVNYLCKVGCRTLFSTHYHSLVESFKHHSEIALGHMSCMVENDDDNDLDTEETVVFLYKFIEGACPKSYGFNAARLAGMPQEIIKVGRARSKQFENDMKKRSLFNALFNSENYESYRTVQID